MIRKLAIASALLSTFCAGPASALVVDGELEGRRASATLVGLSMDLYALSTAGGAFVFLVPDTPTYDPALWLYRDDRPIDVGDLVAFNDDCFCTPLALGARIEIALAPGDYLLAVGWFPGNAPDPADPLDGILFGTPETFAAGTTWTRQSYQLTVTGPITSFAPTTFDRGTDIPLPGTLALAGLGLAGLALARRRAAAPGA